MPGVTTPDTSYAAQPARATQAARNGDLFIAHVKDIVALDAAGGLHLHLLAGFLADEGAAERRAVGDLAGLDVGLVLADDLPGRLLAAVLLDVHRGAEHAAALGIEQPGVDLLRVGELRLDVADARLDEALALARRVVLGVLGEVAVRLASTGFTMTLTSPVLIMSTMCVLPSATLFTCVTAMPWDFRIAAVPRVASSEKLSSTRSSATCTAACLSASRTLMKALPPCGRRTPAASCDFTYASPKVSPTPITSPVDFISGPRMVSTPGNLANGNTASFTEKYGGVTSSLACWSFRLLPAMQRAAIMASGTPVAFDT